MKEESTVGEIIEEVKVEICSFYCKWPEKWNTEAEGCELQESTLCENCPLRRLS